MVTLSVNFGEPRVPPPLPFLSGADLPISSRIVIDFTAMAEGEKMAANKDRKAFCVLDFHICKSVITVQCNFRRQFGEDAPSEPNIHKWYTDFKATGCICKRKSTGHPPVRRVTVEHVRESFMQSLQKSTATASGELDIPQPTALKPDDKAKRLSFYEEMQIKMETDGYSKSLVFSDQATFHLSGKVHKHNVKIWGLENPKGYVEHVCDSTKLNVFCAISHQKDTNLLGISTLTNRNTKNDSDPGTLHNMRKVEALIPDRRVVEWIGDFLRGRRQEGESRGGNIGGRGGYLRGIAGKRAGSFDIHHNDDSVVYAVVGEGGGYLQADLHEIWLWTRKNKLKVNVRKTTVVRFTRKKMISRDMYRWEGQEIEEAAEYKYLGIVLQGDLRVVAKGRRALGMLGRVLNGVSCEVKKKVYGTMVQPMLEYAAAVWDPYVEVEVRELEKLQRKAASWVKGKWRRQGQYGEEEGNYRPSVMMKEMGWSSLKDRRILERGSGEKVVRCHHLWAAACHSSGTKEPGCVDSVISPSTHVVPRCKKEEGEKEEEGETSGRSSPHSLHHVPIRTAVSPPSIDPCLHTAEQPSSCRSAAHMRYFHVVHPCYHASASHVSAFVHTRGVVNEQPWPGQIPCGAPASRCLQYLCYLPTDVVDRYEMGTRFCKCTRKTSPIVNRIVSNCRTMLQEQSEKKFLDTKTSIILQHFQEMHLCTKLCMDSRTAPISCGQYQAQAHHKCLSNAEASTVTGLQYICDNCSEHLQLQMLQKICRDLLTGSQPPFDECKQTESQGEEKLREQQDMARKETVPEIAISERSDTQGV
ncbi:hypothetical protein PR048_023852 [Dryococelus australis]|uniref:DUF4817 domain-containing protein n=1 Tax=Dryococelus australis TaxID=614101 RepID=A0ABQ9GV75_9NEOP|nr:hypothetical protein PR048_023852 [Dryococelus australis]